MLEWRWKRMEQIDVMDLYRILKLRQDVFVIEQSCIYPDMDNRDITAWHLAGVDGDGAIVACLRVLPPDVEHKFPRIGRVAVTEAARGKKLARSLMTEGIRRTRSLYPECAIRISAQQYLKKFYESLGFEEISDIYLEDGIPHLDMVLNGPR